MMPKQLTQDEIVKILNQHTENGGSSKIAEPERCRHCRSILAPYIDEGRVFYACFDCDGPSSPSR